jgi:RNA polymerase sigma-70 factor, ECF subfamily
MSMLREFTLTELEGSDAAAEAAEAAFHMDEETFRLFYERTARPLWSYLSRLCGNASLAEDLVQESYYRFLRADLRSGDEAYQKHYLFRIATNLMHDHWRRTPRRERLEAWSTTVPEAEGRITDHVHERADLERALAALKPRQREILWLAYVEGCSHKEIAAMVGVRAASIRLLLFRARRKLAGLLRKASAEGLEPSRRANA